jgi:hypothetical protein
MGIGGDLTKDLIVRLCNSTHNTVRLAAKFGLAAEIIITEWNMPKGADLCAAFAWPKSETKVRIIHTGNAHENVPNPHGFRYFEWYPKNIGIRRAEGQFVLSTNPDDIFSDEMMEFFAAQKLQSGYFYRAIRYDMRDGKVFQKCWPTGPKPVNATDEEIRQPIGPRACPYTPEMLAYCASGDFTLMSKTDWFTIRGNPEKPYNDSIDGETLWLAHTTGIKQIILLYPIYHPDHPRTLNHSEKQNAIWTPDWNDNHPHATQNTASWGFSGVHFRETVIE